MADANVLSAADVTVDPDMLAMLCSLELSTPRAQALAVVLSRCEGLGYDDRPVLRTRHISRWPTPFTMEHAQSKAEAMIFINEGWDEIPASEESDLVEAFPGFKLAPFRNQFGFNPSTDKIGLGHVLMDVHDACVVLHPAPAPTVAPAPAPSTLLAPMLEEIANNMTGTAASKAGTAASFQDRALKLSLTCSPFTIDQGIDDLYNPSKPGYVPAPALPSSRCGSRVVHVLYSHMEGGTRSPAIPSTKVLAFYEVTNQGLNKMLTVSPETATPAQLMEVNLAYYDSLEVAGRLLPTPSVISRNLIAFGLARADGAPLSNGSAYKTFRASLVRFGSVLTPTNALTMLTSMQDAISRSFETLDGTLDTKAWGLSPSG